MVRMLVVAPLVLVVSASLAGAACLKDQSGEVICGAGRCLRDVNGQVYCAGLKYGSILRTSNGQTVCGKGKCLTTLDGEVICSDVEGGGVAKQLDGTIRCEGACERASTELCERMPAGR